MNNNKKPVDFGEIKTSGAVILRRDGDPVRLIPVPRGRDIDIVLRLDRYLGIDAKNIQVTGVFGRDANGKVNGSIPVSAGSQPGEIKLSIGDTYDFDYLVKVKVTK
jgi:hypothetical protein